MRSKHRRAGVSAPEVIVVLAVVLVAALVVATVLPRQRETARAVSCQRNLMQIGMAVSLYQLSRDRLPAVPALTPVDDGKSVPGSSPIAALLGELGLSDFADLNDANKPPARGGGPGSKAGVEEQRVPGFICPGDPNAMNRSFPAPVSYRATAGDRPDGRTGPFAPNRLVRFSDVEAADGLAYTAGFSERLLGTNRASDPDPANYAVVTGPVTAKSSAKAPAPSSYRGDAGSSWARVGWSSTLYNHVLTPFAAPSIVSIDGKTALMGASSGHGNIVHVLMLDGSVRPYTAQVDKGIWGALANTDDGPAREQAPAKK